MKISYLLPLCIALAFAACKGTNHNADSQPALTPIDSIELSDPAILADSASMTYYMTGTRGKLWKSKDLQGWEGPFDVAVTDGIDWMGPNPDIWAAELHKVGDKYYYFATFTNNDTVIGNANGMNMPRRASHVLASDNPEGPYMPAGDLTYLPDSLLTLDATYWEEPDGRKYMIYCNEWLQNNDGTIEYVELKPDMTGTVGEARLMFRASESPWSREMLDGKEGPNRVTDGPWLFRTGTGRLGCIWTSWIHKDYTQGVAYSQSGTIEGPWIQEAEPITPPNYGHGMIFTDLQGHTWLSCHSHEEIDGRYHRVPRLFKADLSGDKLMILNDSQQ